MHPTILEHVSHTPPVLGRKRLMAFAAKYNTGILVHCR
jgi:hypothetical protein